MTDDRADAAHRPDLGEYCRRVEDHLTRANAGHLVRIVGPGFELVRRWAETGVPLSVVYRGIDLKADRHREGAAQRPLRIEFCANDVDALFDHWRRAVGLFASAGTIGAPEPGDEPAHADEAPLKRKSLGKHLERAIDRLSRAGGRLDLPEPLREECTRLIEALVSIRENSRGARGAAREGVEDHLARLDAELETAARTHAPAEWLDQMRSEAAADLAPFRSRLPAEAWQRSMDVTIGRLIRDRLGLPVLAL